MSIRDALYRWLGRQAEFEMAQNFLRAVFFACILTALSFAAETVGAERRSEALIKRMTLDEKLGQLVQRAGGRSKALNSKLTPEELDRVRAGQVGSYLHVAGAAALNDLQRVAVEESRLGIPLLFAMDVVHGYRTIFPVPLAMAATWSPETVEQASRVAATEASAAGLHWTFAPMIDIARDARWGRVVEGAGEDPFLGAAMARAQVRGFQGRSLADADTIMATAKHFGAYGAAIGGRDYNSAEVSERSLHEVYLPPFHAAIDAGAASIMTAFNDINGVPTTSNKTLLRGLLRQRWGFDGLIVSDWNAIHELIAHGVAGDRAEAAVLALNASVDMDMVADVYANDLKARVAADPELMKYLDEAVLRILDTKDALGLFDRPFQYHDVAREAKVMLSAEHRQAARHAATQAIVLLKNSGGLLPIDASNLRSLAVIGSLANDRLSALGSWRAQGREADVVSVLDGLRRALPNMDVRYAIGADPRSDDLSGLDAAMSLVQGADLTVLMLGEHFDLSGEARSRSDIDLPPSQLALAKRVLASGKPVVVLLANGRPLAMPWLAEHASTLVETWMLGVEAGNAVADVLLGKVSPGGKLPMQFPQASGTMPDYYGARTTGRPADADISKDTVRYLDRPITSVFPFGHGLSYSRFTFDDLKQSGAALDRGDSLTLSFTLRNVGSMQADEVVQLYVRDPVASVARPVMELRGFQRIALAAGAQQTVQFRLQPEQLALYSEQGVWQVEAGRFDYMIGSSSRDIRLRGSFHVGESFATDVPAAAVAVDPD
jgi:beta-glucosidase